MASRVLITCPPMLGMIDQFRARFEEAGIELDCPQVTQTLEEQELINIIGDYDGWIIGDDPATSAVLEAGAKGRLRAAVKWGVGVDNVDFDAADQLGIKTANTPNMFGSEVADVAMGYITGLARNLFWVDHQVRTGEWPKPCGVSLAGKRVGLVGYGDIGKHLLSRLRAAGMCVAIYDPALSSTVSETQASVADWPCGVGELDFIVLTCSLNHGNYQLVGDTILQQFKRGVRIVNVSRGALIDEIALIRHLNTGQVASAALDVFEVEPLPMDSPLRKHEKCIFGTHNSSNTVEGVRRASIRAIDILLNYLEN